VFKEGWTWAVHCALFNAFKVRTQLHKNGKMTYEKLLLKVTKQWADDQPPSAVTTDGDENNNQSSQAGSTWQTIWGHEEIQHDKDCGYEKGTILLQGLQSPKGRNVGKNMVCVQFR
jgi:hypothetical protein